MNSISQETHFFEYPKLPSCEKSHPESESGYPFLYGDEKPEEDNPIKAQTEDSIEADTFSCAKLQTTEESPPALIAESSVQDEINRIIVELRNSIKTQEDVFYDYAVKILSKMATHFFNSEMLRQPDQFSKLIQEIKSKLSIQDKPIQIFLSQMMFEKLQTCFVQVDCQLKVDSQLQGADFYIKTPTAFVDGQFDHLIQEIFSRN